GPQPVGAACRLGRVAVGRDPEPAGRIDGAIIGHAEPAIGGGGGGEGGADLGHGGVAAFQQHFPSAFQRSEVAAVFLDLDDVAEGVLRAGIDAVDLFVGAAGVAGQHHVDLAVDAVGLDVFG